MLLASSVSAKSSKKSAAIIEAKSSTKKTSAKTVSTVADGDRTVFEDLDALEQTAVNNSVLAGVGSLAVLYAGYEYR